MHPFYIVEVDSVGFYNFQAACCPVCTGRTVGPTGVRAQPHQSLSTCRRLPSQAKRKENMHKDPGVYAPKNTYIRIGVGEETDEHASRRING